MEIVERNILTRSFRSQSLQPIHTHALLHKSFNRRNPVRFQHENGSLPTSRFREQILSADNTVNPRGMIILNVENIVPVYDCSEFEKSSFKSRQLLFSRIMGNF